MTNSQHPETDYRETLYARYVSTFKDEHPITDETVAASVAVYHQVYGDDFRDLLRDSHILEVGCGPGTFLEYLQGQGFEHVEGIDISAEQIAIAQSRGVNAVVADVFAHLQQEHGAYDVIIGIDFIEHFRKDEIIPLGDAIFQALVPGGRLIFQTPNGSGLFASRIIYGDLTHSTIFNASSMEQYLRLLGFEAVRVRPVNPAGRAAGVRLVIWSLVTRTLNLLRRIEAGKPPQIWTENMIAVAQKPTT